MKKSTKNTNKEAKKATRAIAIDLTAWEYKEGDKVDTLRCSVYAGKDKNGEYNKDIPVRVMISEDTELIGDVEKIDGRTPVCVGGDIQFERNKEYINITIWANRVEIRN